MNSRKIVFEGIFNSRDLGGLEGNKGSIISSGHLIRSAKLSDATEEDVKVLKEKYRLAKIIDLRTETEQSESPDMTIDGVEHISIPIFDEATAGISHEKKQDDANPFGVVPDMKKLYAHMATNKACRENLGKAAKYVMRNDFSKGSVIWHCTEGKDRCGMLSLVLLAALGVEREIIREDYLLTNDVNKAKSEMYYQKMLAAGKTEEEAAGIRDVFLAKEEYLNEFFAAVDDNYKSMDDFIHKGMNISKKMTKKFKSIMLG